MGKKEEAELKKKKEAEEKKKQEEIKKLLAEAGENFCKAADNGKTKIVQKLLDAGGSPDEQDGKGRRPLQVAIVSGNAGIVKLLLDGKANVNLEGKGIQTGPTFPLHVAAREGDPDIAKLLLEAGADTGLKNQRNQSAEMVAEGKKNMNFVKIIREHNKK